MQQLRRLPLKQISVNIDTSNGVAYGAGDQIGVAVRVPEVNLDGEAAYIKAIDAVCKSAISPAFCVCFYGSEPTLISTDNNPLDISDAELTSKFQGKVDFATTDWSVLANAAVASKVWAGSGLIVKSMLPRNNDVWIVLMAKAAITFTSIQDLVIKIDIEQG